MTLFSSVVFECLSDRKRAIVSKLSVKEWDNVVLNCSHVTRSIPPALVSWEMSPDGDDHFRPVQLGEEISQMASIHKILSLYCLLYIGLFRSAALGISTIAGWFRCFAFKAIYLRRSI